MTTENTAPRNISRRGFFRSALKSATEASDSRSLELARLWFRPPFAGGEIAFLEACTKCGDCIAVCPPGALFSLPEKYGARAAGTPAIDLETNACLLCEDWPCVTACEPGALKIPEPAADDGAAGEDIPLAPMARLKIDIATCLPYSGPECGACADSWPVAGAFIWQGTKPRIDPAHCVGCGLCRQACITDPKSVSISLVEALQ